MDETIHGPGDPRPQRNAWSSLLGFGKNGGSPSAGGLLMMYDRATAVAVGTVRPSYSAMCAHNSDRPTVSRETNGGLVKGAFYETGPASSRRQDA